ncbi:MAG: YncE family protein [Acidimicrobiia bacterium]|nr:YncE family protein [Acidimicrobiia bacterium]
MTSHAVKVRRMQVGIGATVIVLAVSTFAVNAGADRTTTATALEEPRAATTTLAPNAPVTVVRPPSASTRMTPSRVISGTITPKSVVASGGGQVFAQNMMYSHTITVYNAAGDLQKTISDAVELSQLGLSKTPGAVRGAPVEAAFSPDGRYAYVSNYAMYGPGYINPGDDVCKPGQYDNSFLYRVDVATMALDRVYAVGSVPKFVAVTPDNRYVLVTNWCSYDMSILDTATGATVKRVPLGPYPRGIVVDPSSTTAYVAVMGTTDVAKVRLSDFATTWMRGVGKGPRHLVMDPAGASLYVTLNGADEVAKVDLGTGAVVDRLATGKAPRSMTIAPDGQSLYVVNYESNTISKVRAADMTLLQDLPTKVNPIGITYEPVSHTVWVACYSGSILVFKDT